VNARELAVRGALARLLATCADMVARYTFDDSRSWPPVRGDIRGLIRTGQTAIVDPLSAAVDAARAELGAALAALDADTATRLGRPEHPPTA
jgi:hypothetical protein